jgi:hypothetical protein
VVQFAKAYKLLGDWSFAYGRELGSSHHMAIGSAELICYELQVEKRRFTFEVFILWTYGSRYFHFSSHSIHCKIVVIPLDSR